MLVQAAAVEPAQVGCMAATRGMRETAATKMDIVAAT